MARFFERIVAAEQQAVALRIEVPPYLFSHPDVESRIDAALTRAERLTITGEPDPELPGALRVAQVRLALLLRSGQTTLLSTTPPPDRSVSGPILEEANALAARGETRAAIARLLEGETLEPNDPRLPFRRGELLRERERTREAIAAWRRALLLDPSVALNYFRIGLAYKSLGDRVNATFYLEQAQRRFEPGGVLQRRASKEIERLTFPVVAEAGLADGERSAGADTVAGHSRDTFARGEPRVVWWASVSSRYLGRRDEISVRFTDPAGRIVQERKVDALRRPHVTATLSLAGLEPAPAGIWRVEALYEGDLVDRRTFRLEP
jgi:predicted Zn-dependent protease